MTDPLIKRRFVFPLFYDKLKKDDYEKLLADFKKNLPADDPSAKHYGKRQFTLEQLIYEGSFFKNHTILNAIRKQTLAPRSASEWMCRTVKSVVDCASVR